MKDLLYLKDEHLKEFIEKLFIGYRESFGDAKKTLDKYSLATSFILPSFNLILFLL